jgi:hypothetical protein
MRYMLCRNKVRDFATWKRVFDTHAAAHRAAGLELLHVARNLGDPNDVYFVFEIDTVERAKAFINAPGAAAAAGDSGVMEGEYRFVESTTGYA